MYSLFVAAFVMLGAKLGKLFGERLVFQVSAVAHGVAMAIMAFSRDASMMNIAQIIAGLAAALLVPTLVVLIAANYRGQTAGAGVGHPGEHPGHLQRPGVRDRRFYRHRVELALFVRPDLFAVAPGAGPELSPHARARARKTSRSILSGSCCRPSRSRSSSLPSTTSIGGAWCWRPRMRRSACWACRPCRSSSSSASCWARLSSCGSNGVRSGARHPCWPARCSNSPEERNAVIAFLVAGALGSAISFLIPLYIQIVPGQHAALYIGRHRALCAGRGRGRHPLRAAL